MFSAFRNTSNDNCYDNNNNQKPDGNSTDNDQQSFLFRSICCFIGTKKPPIFHRFFTKILIYLSFTTIPFSNHLSIFCPKSFPYENKWRSSEEEQWERLTNIFIGISSEISNLWSRHDVQRSSNVDWNSNERKSA